LKAQRPDRADETREVKSGVLWFERTGFLLVIVVVMPSGRDVRAPGTSLVLNTPNHPSQNKTRTGYDVLELK
jgi:hypothetical protein